MQSDTLLDVQGITLDESRLPILIVRWGNDPSTENFTEYLHAMTEYITARELRARVTIHDTSRGFRAQATFRREQAEWMKRYQLEIKRAALGIGFVMTNSIVRGMLTAVMWVQPMPVPYDIFATLDESIVWADGLLAQANIPRRWTAPPLTGS